MQPQTRKSAEQIDNINGIKAGCSVFNKPYVICAYEIGDNHIKIYFHGLFCDRVA